MTNPALNEKSIFLHAIELTSAKEREIYLDAACGGNQPLREELDALLRAHDRPPGILDPPEMAAPTVDLPLITEQPGTQIGPYRLREKIGEGGMGVVYLADQERPVRRRVALKVIKPGLDTEQVVARFQAERQALALMDHPSIAKVLEAGATDTGRPYFVMELVKGVSITQYCDTVHLTLKERLALFIPVCQAIQHAHQKGIIHRDMKPSNVLVAMLDGKPVPKIIDFGIAKATEQRLTERSLFTQHGTIVGTLEYMSPEQAEMSAMDVDTRTDIYALGVLLYELLTGTTPLERSRLQQSGYAEILRRIREEEPPKPSTRLSSSNAALASIATQRRTEPAKLAKLVMGELDWIVMKALEKDRTRRYETANGLARDVERYLQDEPVEACPPSAMYRVRKYAQRHRGLLTTVVAFAALLVLGAAVSTYQAVRATAARNRAERAERLAGARLVAVQKANSQTQRALAESEEARRQAEVVSRHLVDIFHRLDPTQDGRQVKVVDLLDHAAQELDAELAGAPKVKGQLLSALGDTYWGLGLRVQAAGQYKKALSLRQAALGPDHPDTIESTYKLAEAYQEAGRFEEAMPLFVESLKLCKAKFGPDHPSTLESMFVLAWAYETAGRLEEAISLHEETLRLRKAKLGSDHPSTLHSMLGLAASYHSAGRLDQAIPLYEETLKLREAKLGHDDTGTIQSMHALAWGYQDAGRLDDAIRLSTEAVKLKKARLGPNHPDTLIVMEIQAGALGLKLLEERKYAEAEPLLRQGLSLRERHGPRDWSRFNFQSLLGDSLLGMKQYEKAEPLLLEGYDGMKQLEAKNPAALEHQLAEAGERVVRLYDEWGQPEKAAEWRAKLAPKPRIEKNKRSP